MLNLNCAICSELYTAADDVHATFCGHMFHVSCLNQWFQRSKTCPQCRNKLSDRNVIRIYFNNTNLDCSRVDVATLQEQLNSAHAQLLIKKNELQKAEDEIKKSKETQKKCMKTIAGLEQDLQSKSFLILNYVEKTKMLESQLKFMDDVRKEVKDLREKIRAMENVNSLLASSMSEAENLLKNESDPKILSLWVATLKRELKVCENRKADMRNVLKIVQNDLRKEIDLKKSQEDKISQLESENYQLLQKIKSLEGGLIKNNTSSNNNVDIPRRKSLDLNNALVETPRIKQEQNSFISPTVQQNIKTIEESVSPYLNIKSCNVLLPPLLLRNQDNRINNNIKPLGNKVTTLKVSPTKADTGTIRKSNTDLNQKYSILKKRRTDAAVGTSGHMKPLPANYVFNGYGGSERVDPFEHHSYSDDEIEKAKKHTQKTHRSALPSSIHNRLKSGGLRDIKVTK